MLSSEYPLVKGRQAVAIAWEWEHTARVQVMHSERSWRHIPESEWDGDQTPLATQSSSQMRSPSPYLSGEEQLTRSPAPCWESECIDPCSLPATSTRGQGNPRCGAQRGRRNAGVGRTKWKSGPALDLTPPSSPSPPRPPPNNSYSIDLSVSSRALGQWHLPICCSLNALKGAPWK